MHRFRRALIVVPLAALGLTGLAAAAAPQTYLLRLHQGEGDKATYALTSVAKAQVSIPNEPLQKLSATTNLKCAVEFLGLAPDDTMRAEGEIVGGSTVIEESGHTETVPVDGLVVDYLLTPRAEVKEADLLSGVPPMVASTGIFYTPDDAFLVAPLPDKPVKVGDRWQGVAQVPVVSGQPGEKAEVKHDSKVLGQVAYAGRNCLKVKTNLRHFWQASLDAPDGSGTLMAKLHATATAIWLFDPKEGLVMKADVTVAADVTLRLQSITAGEQTAKVTATEELHTRLTEYNGTKVPAK
jgi:hypothetical protein